MNAIQQLTENPSLPGELPYTDPEGHIHLCMVRFDTGSRSYRMLLEADVSRVSLEGMKQYTLLLRSKGMNTAAQEWLRAELELNLRQESSVSIDGNHLSASRQDYVRDMTALMGSRHDELRDSVVDKATCSDHCLL